MLASTSLSLFNAAGHQCGPLHRQLHTCKTSLPASQQSECDSDAGCEQHILHVPLFMMQSLILSQYTGH